MTCIKDENFEELQGLLYDYNKTALNIDLLTCKQQDLEPGQSCMDEEEVTEYLSKKYFIF